MLDFNHLSGQSVAINFNYFDLILSNVKERFSLMLLLHKHVYIFDESLKATRDEIGIINVTLSCSLNNHLTISLCRTLLSDVIAPNLSFYFISAEQLSFCVLTIT